MQVSLSRELFADARWASEHDGPRMARSPRRLLHPNHFGEPHPGDPPSRTPVATRQDGFGSAERSKARALDAGREYTGAVNLFQDVFTNLLPQIQLPGGKVEER